MFNLSTIIRFVVAGIEFRRSRKCGCKPQLFFPDLSYNSLQIARQGFPFQQVHDTATPEFAAACNYNGNTRMCDQICNIVINVALP